MSSVDTEDEKLLAQLRAEVFDQTPPPVHTALADVVRRGRRRVRGRRIGAAVGVIAVVTGVGITAAMLRDVPGRNQLTAATAGSSPAPTSLSGWAVASPPATSRKDSTDCANGVSVPGEPKVEAIGVDTVNNALVAALRDVDSKALLKITKSSAAKQPTSGDGVLASTWVDVVDAGGGGSVYVEVHGFSGTPQQAADNEQFVNGGCVPPQRKTLADGTVMQLYPALKYDPGHPSQALRIYTPQHRLYVITAEGFSSADWTQVAGAEPGTLAVPEGAGRHSLPLTETQLIAVGERLATLG